MTGFDAGVEVRCGPVSPFASEEPLVGGGVVLSVGTAEHGREEDVVHVVGVGGCFVRGVVFDGDDVPSAFRSVP